MLRSLLGAKFVETRGKCTQMVKFLDLALTRVGSANLKVQVCRSCVIRFIRIFRKYG